MMIDTNKLYPFSHTTPNWLTETLYRLEERPCYSTSVALSPQNDHSKHIYMLHLEKTKLEQYKEKNNHEKQTMPLDPSSSSTTRERQKTALLYVKLSVKELKRKQQGPLLYCNYAGEFYAALLDYDYS